MRLERHLAAGDRSRSISSHIARILLKIKNQNIRLSLSMVLKEILKQPPSSVLIEGILVKIQFKQSTDKFILHPDSWEIKGRPLFLSLVKHYSENGFKIHYLKYDSSLSSEKEEMKELDIQIERPNWNNDNLASDLLNAWRLAFSKAVNLIVAIDSLSPLLIHCPIKEIITVVKEMAQKSE